MKILWISSIKWNLVEDKDIKSSGIVSGSLFERNIINGLEENGAAVDLLCTTVYSDNKRHREVKWSHREGATDVYLPYEVKRTKRFVSELFLFSKFLKKMDLYKYDVVIAYLVHLPFLRALKKSKLINKSIKTVLVCPDLFNMMDLKASFFKKFAKRIEKLFLNNYFKYVDGYVLFTKYMIEQMPIKEGKYIVVEGVNSTEPNFSLKQRKNNPFVLMYAGSLQFNFGIENIIDAIDLIKNEGIELHIYGDGPLSQIVIEKSHSNPCVKFYRFVDHNIVVQREREADLLINCRDPLLEYTKYSFPSKTFEYLLSGTPFLTTRLRGIPEEYYEFLFAIDDNRPSTIAKEIIRIKSLSDREINSKVMKGIQFVIKEKNYIVQSKKILDFIRGKLLCF